MISLERGCTEPLGRGHIRAVTLNADGRDRTKRTRLRQGPPDAHISVRPRNDALGICKYPGSRQMTRSTMMMTAETLMAVTIAAKSEKSAKRRHRLVFAGCSQTCPSSRLRDDRFAPSSAKVSLHCQMTRRCASGEKRKKKIHYRRCAPKKETRLRTIPRAHARDRACLPSSSAAEPPPTKEKISGSYHSEVITTLCGKLAPPSFFFMRSSTRSKGAVRRFPFYYSAAQSRGQTCGHTPQ